MKYLTLIRHAKSSWDTLGLADRDRPLNGRGQRDAPEMGRRLAASGFDPDLILISPAQRTRQTWAALQAEWTSTPNTRIEPALYMAGESTLLALIRNTDKGIQHLVLIGHNPGMTGLANWLGEDRIDNIPTAGVVRFALDIKGWQTIEAGQDALIDFDYPKRREN